MLPYDGEMGQWEHRCSKDVPSAGAAEKKTLIPKKQSCPVFSPFFLMSVVLVREICLFSYGWADFEKRSIFITSAIVPPRKWAGWKKGPPCF